MLSNDDTFRRRRDAPRILPMLSAFVTALSAFLTLPSEIPTMPSEF
jgi:hypothetical protein